MSSEQSENRFYFEDSRLRMTLVGRMFVRVISSVSYLLLFVAAPVALFSDLVWLKWTGTFLFLFLLDRLFHWREADKPLAEMPVAGRVNLDSYVAPDAFSVIERALEKGKLVQETFFLRVLKELLRREEIKESLERLDVKPQELTQKVEELLTKPRSEKADYTVQAETLMLRAGERALALHHRFIGVGDLFSALFTINDGSLTRAFSLFSLNVDDLEMALILSSKISRRWRYTPSFVGGFRFEAHRRLRHRIMNRAWTSRPTPLLDNLSTDFTDLARGGYIGFLVGHDVEYKHLVDILSRPINPNALLIGELGIGKETIVAHLAFNINRDSVLPPLFDKRLVALSISNLVAGASPEELQNRLQKIVSEILIAENLILYIPDIHNLVKTSGTAYLSAADALLPIFKNNDFPVIGSTYPREYKEFIEPRSDFLGLFEAIMVQEMSEEEAKKLLVYESLLLEREARIIVSFAAVKTAVKVAKRYFHQKPLPGSAEELLKAGLIIASRKGEKVLSENEIIQAAEEKTNIPIHQAGTVEAQNLLDLDKTIHRRLIDQEEAVGAVSDALRQYRSGLSRSGGPIASFLFVGPTGVGKTELARTLAQINFGSEKEMIRFDMSEYQDKESFLRFIGSPDGRIKGELTEAILQKPYALILLDEFEKSFPDIWNLFLQVFDDGRLTDNLGRTIDFQNTIIIATSNAHSDLISESLAKGETMANIAEYLKSRLADVFKPELLNRFSKIIVFKELSAADIQEIALLNLNNLAVELGGQGVDLSFSDSAVREVARLGYDPSFGARPLRRTIEEKIKTSLAGKILRQEIARGSKVEISFDGQRFQFLSTKS